jgi:hypothetical protein
MLFLEIHQQGSLVLVAWKASLSLAFLPGRGWLDESVWERGEFVGNLGGITAQITDKKQFP